MGCFVSFRLRTSGTSSSGAGKLRRLAAQRGGDRGRGGGGVAVVESGDQRAAADPLDQSHRRGGVAHADDQVALPMAEFAAPGGFSGPAASVSPAH